jgi:hypothetical protein
LDATGDDAFLLWERLTFTVVNVDFFLAGGECSCSWSWTFLKIPGDDDVGWLVLKALAFVVFAVRRDVGGGGDAGFVTFPSDARSLLREVDFTLYLDFCGFCDSVTPVRGREDTERDGDAGVKVQIAWSRGVPSCKPLELFENCSRGRQERTSWLREGGSKEGLRAKMGVLYSPASRRDI